MVIIISIIKIIIVFGIIVGMHEGAHFLMAKKNNIYVKEFAIGFGPKVFSKEKNGTLYTLRAIPLGGFNDLAEEIQLDSEEARNRIKDKNQQYYKEASAKIRFQILAAGVTVNIIFAIILFFTIHLFKTNRSLVVDYVGNEFKSYGIIQENDQILKIDGKKIHVIADVDNYLYTNRPEKVQLTINRNGAEQELEVPVSTSDDTGHTRYLLGVSMKWADKTIKNQLYFSYWNTIDFVSKTLNGYRLLITGKASMDNFSGPIGIGETIAKSQGLYEICYYIAAISISLGIINLFPIPGLDGGKIFLLIIELIRGKKIDEDVETVLSLIGIGLLLLFAVFITKNDITNFIIK